VRQCVTDRQKRTNLAASGAGEASLSHPVAIIWAMDAWRELMRRVETRHGIVTFDDLIGAGASPALVLRGRRSGRLVDVHRGVFRVAGAPDSPEARAIAALHRFDDTTWVSHHTAAQLWGLRIFAREMRIEVVRATELSAGRSCVRVHRSTRILPHHVTTLRGVPLTTPSRTIFDLARTTDPPRLARVVKQAVQTDHIPCSIASLYRVLYDLGGQGRPGTRRMRTVLDAWNEGEPATESELDEISRALMQHIPGIRWQVEISDEQGYIRRVDGIVDPIGLILEFDSRFHDDPAQRALDAENDRRLLALGLLTRRYRWLDLTRRGDITLAELERLLVTAAAA
jgi:hypothetical protein